MTHSFKTMIYYKKKIKTTAHESWKFHKMFMIGKMKLIVKE